MTTIDTSSPQPSSQRTAPGTAPHPEVDGIAKVNDLISGLRTAMLTTIDQSTGVIRSRPMACQDAEFDGTLWFFTYADSDKVAEISANHVSNVTFSTSDSWVSLSGEASAVHDPAKARELWNPFAAAWFDCEPEDPKVTLIRFDADGAEYWDSPSKVGQAISTVRALVTGGSPDGGENEKVSF